MNVRSGSFPHVFFEIWASLTYFLNSPRTFSEHKPLFFKCLSINIQTPAGVVAFLKIKAESRLSFNGIPTENTLGSRHFQPPFQRNYSFFHFSKADSLFLRLRCGRKKAARRWMGAEIDVDHWAKRMEYQLSPPPSSTPTAPPPQKKLSHVTFVEAHKSHTFVRNPLMKIILANFIFLA